MRPRRKGNEFVGATYGPIPDAVQLFMGEHYAEGTWPLTRISGEPPHLWTGKREDLLPPYAMVPSLLLPGGFAEPLRDALDELLGRPHDDYRARAEELERQLAVERERVDRFLQLFGAAAERAMAPPRSFAMDTTKR